MSPNSSEFVAAGHSSKWNWLLRHAGFGERCFDNFLIRPNAASRTANIDIPMALHRFKVILENVETEEMKLIPADLLEIIFQGFKNTEQQPEVW